MDCCRHSTKNKKCVRKDGKTFKLPRRFTRKTCLSNKVKGFTMRSSCAPYKFCKQKTKKSTSSFMFNPDNPNKSFDVYIDKNPHDTIPIKYKTLDDVKATITKLEKLYKNDKHSHKRIWQVAMIMKVRLQAILKHKSTLYTKTKNINSRYNLSNKYFKFLGERTRTNKNKRKSMNFII